MRIVDCIQKQTALWIIRIGAGAKKASSHIDSVRARMNGCLQAFKGTGRSQYLQFFSIHRFHPTACKYKTGQLFF